MFSQPLRRAARLFRSADPRGARPAGRLTPRSQLWVEGLEDRTLPAVFEVTTVADAGPGSLRQAILDSNASPGQDTIAFEVGGGGVQTIRPTSDLPTTTDAVVIDGTTQPGFAGSPLIELNGGLAGSGAVGLSIFAGNTTVKGLVINGFSDAGINVFTGGNVVIAGNYIGTDVVGTTAVATNGFYGVLVSSANNTIGGLTAGDRNLISGHRSAGVFITGVFATDNRVQGNYIGTDVTGTRALGNITGVFVMARSNLIGGSEPGAGNLISGDQGNGVFIGNDGTLFPEANRVEGNRIGTDATGTRVLGNAIGVFVSGSGNTIGGTTEGARNIISGNSLQGVRVGDGGATGNLIHGNFIGTDITGTAALGNDTGVLISDQQGNVVGGDAAGTGNLISGNIGAGVHILGVGARSNRVQGNLIGTDATGTRAVANGAGVLVEFGSNNQIGGTGGAGNLISGNAGVGVEIRITPPSEGATGNLIQGNRIGTDVTGTADLGNQTGVLLNAPNNAVGGEAAGAGNLISGNLVFGVRIQTSGNLVAGNRIGTDAAGDFALGNATGISMTGANNTIGGEAAGAGNLISGNTNLGVELVGSGATGNRVQGNRIGTNAAGTTTLRNIYGVYVSGASNNLIGGTAAGARNLISGNFVGVALFGASNNLVAGNFVGTDAAGAARVSNFNGVEVLSGTGNLIGGTEQGAGNLIAGNTNVGVALFASGNQVQGNRIGTDVTGTADLGNQTGVHVGGSNNLVGGTAAGARNLISGNAGSGIEISGGATGNRVEGNRIGTDVTGTADLGNRTGLSVSGFNHTIGGTAAGAGNVISGNSGDGVAFTGGGRHLVQGNSIGTDLTGNVVLPNGGNGVFLSHSSDNTIGGTVAGAGNVISGNEDFGVLIADSGAGGNVLAGNRIGTNAEGTAARGNGAGGVLIRSPGNTVGGVAPGASNLISGNMRSSSHPFSDGAGVSIWGEAATGNVVAGNLIGTDATGTKTLFNPRGVLLRAANNLIGGTQAGARNVISGNSTGVALEFGAHANRVEGNFIGTDAAGMAAIPNNWGISLYFGPTGNVIGGTAPGAGNLISGNIERGIYLTEATHNRVEGNLIGTDVTGSRALGNIVGVYVYHGGNNDIGGTAPGAGNLISGNRGAGVYLDAMGASLGNRVQGNLIGTDRGGAAALGNYAGVVLESPGNLVGGTAAGARNVISGNLTDGVLVRFDDGNMIQGNYIGTDAAGAFALGNQGNGVVIVAASGTTVGGPEVGAGNVIAFNGGDGVRVGDGTGNAIRGNRVFANGGLGIDLGGNGVTSNDPSDTDSGANQFQNFPVLSAAQPGANTWVTGTLNSAASTTFTLDFYASPAADPSGFGEGARYLGSAAVTTDGSGNARFEVVLAGATAPGEVVTATATDPAGNTSEFSLAEVVAGGTVIIRRPRR